MVPLSHEAPINMTPGPASTQLTQGFSEFIAASARLELAYGELQGRVAALNLRLQEQGRALRESEHEKDNHSALLRQIVEAMPCGVLLLDENETVRLANPEAARLLALASAQLPEGSAASLPASLVPRLLRAKPQQEQRVTDQELPLQSSAGSHWIRLRRMPVGAFAGNAGPLVSTVLVLEDITARKLEERSREADRNSAALAQVAALLAHEIRNPLASLELFAGLLIDSPDRQQEWHSHLRAGIRSLSGTVNNVLTLHGEALPAPEAVELSSETQMAVQFLQPLAMQAGAQLLHSHAGDELWVQANRSALHQLVLNLVTNALRHAPGGVVQVHTYRHSLGMIHVAVTDNGCGIRTADLPKLFESGFSASGTRPGLGLAVCQRLMRHHGGSIHVQSQPGKGSTFTLEFPAV